MEIYIWSIIWKKIDLTHPQWPPTKKSAKFNMSFHDFVKKFVFKTSVIFVLKLLNSSTWKILKSSVVVFQALETSPASLTSAASATSLASTASKAQFPQKTSWSWLEWIIKNPIFTKIWHLFWRRPLRPQEVKKVSNGGSGITSYYSESQWASVFGRFNKTSGQARSLLYENQSTFIM